MRDDSPHHFARDDMRSLLDRSRDIVAVARVMQAENADLGLPLSVNVVLGALHDMNSDSERASLEDIADAVDELRKRLT